MITDEEKHRNARALIEHFILRDSEIKDNKDNDPPFIVETLRASNKEGEWQTLSTVLIVDHLRAIHDGVLIAARLDVLQKRRQRELEDLGCLKRGG
jgi:hypothetical protein